MTRLAVGSVSATLRVNTSGADPLTLSQATIDSLEADPRQVLSGAFMAQWAISGATLADVTALQESAPAPTSTEESGSGTNAGELAARSQERLSVQLGFRAVHCAALPRWAS